MGSNDRDATFRDWCKKDGVSTLQSTAITPARSSYHVSTSSHLHRSHLKVASSTPSDVLPVSYSRHTDHMATYQPPSSMQPYQRDPNKFDALSRTTGWAPHNANAAGSQRAIYDPVSHKTTLYTFNNTGGVSWIEGQGNKLMLEKQQKDLNSGSRGLWQGRRKGVVEFVDRTHSFAVNQNKEFINSVAHNEHAYHTKTGELTKWMDNAFEAKMKVPFYGKHPYEMNK